MKTQLFYCFKSMVLATGLLLCNMAQAQVSVVTVIEPGSYGTPTIAAISGDACLSYDLSGTGNDQTFELTGTGLSSLTYSWTKIGGISLQSTSGNQATIRPVIDGQGRYNKGRLKVLYKGLKDTLVDAGECNGSPKQITIQIPKSGVAYVDVYQKFTFTDQIVGNVCVSERDSNAYSIKDLVSGNISDGIGIDSYFWTYSDLQTGVAPFLIADDDTKYVSGDNSAITFLFEKDPAGGEQIFVGVGKCNTADPLKVKTLGRKIPPADAEISPSGCVPVTTHQISITNIAATGIVYEWVLGNSNFTFASGSTPTDASGITVNIGTYAGDIYLISSPDPGGSNYCNANGKRVDTLHVIRSLDNSVTVSGPNCVAPGTYTYSVTPNPGTALDWKLPAGFDIIGGAANEHAAIIQVTVASNAVSGNIVAATSDCSSDTVYLAVNIKPGNPAAIVGDTCLTPGDLTVQNYSVSSVTPAAVSYLWTKPANWTGTSITNSINLTPDASSTTGQVTVQAIGLAGCNSDVSSVNINYTPAKPDSILVLDACITSGRRDTITLQVQTPVAGLTYTWEVSPAWTILSNSNTSITVETNETDGSYYAKVYGSNTCGSSAWEERNVIVSGTPFTIRETDLAGGGSRAYYDIEEADNDDSWYISSPYTIHWTLISSLGAHTDVTEPTYTPSTKTRTNFQGFVTGTMTSQALCTDVVITATGCLTRKCLGASPIPGGNNFRSVTDPSSIGYSVNELAVYPNPAQSTLTVNLIGNKGSNIKLIDSQGNIVYKDYSEAEELELNVSSYPAGLYTLVASGGKSDLSQKVVITK